MTNTQTGSITRTSLIVVLAVGILLTAAVMLLPKGFSDNLAKIGQGSVVAVLIHDKNTMGSMDFMALINEVRSDYAGEIEFLAVDMATREGQALPENRVRVPPILYCLVRMGQDGGWLA